MLLRRAFWAAPFKRNEPVGSLCSKSRQGTPICLFPAEGKMAKLRVVAASKAIVHADRVDLREQLARVIYGRPKGRRLTWHAMIVSDMSHAFADIGIGDLMMIDRYADSCARLPPYDARFRQRIGTFRSFAEAKSACVDSARSYLLSRIFRAEIVSAKISSMGVESLSVEELACVLPEPHDLAARLSQYIPLESVFALQTDCTMAYSSLPPFTAAMSGAWDPPETVKIADAHGRVLGEIPEALDGEITRISRRRGKKAMWARHFGLQQSDCSRALFFDGVRNLTVGDHLSELAALSCGPTLSALRQFNDIWSWLGKF